MKKAFLLFYLAGSFLFIIYLFLPPLAFPAPPPGAVQSMEEADTETPLKRAYFTNYTREQVISHYRNQFERKYFPTLKLNYPPEDAQTLIRDQTRSTYLEELVHPFRESLYINGFVPREAKDDIWYKGVHYEEKITIKYSQSRILIRLLIAIPALVLIPVVLRQWIITIRKFE